MENNWHVLEVCLSTPHIELPIGKGNEPCMLFSQVSTFNDGQKAYNASWEEAFIVTLSSNHSVVVISFLIAEPGSHSLEEAAAKGEARLFAEVCFPYLGFVQLGVCADGPPRVLQLALLPRTLHGQESQEELMCALQHALEQFRPDKPWISLSVRETSAPTEWSGQDADWKLPYTKKHVLTLELENVALQGRLCGILPHTIQPAPMHEEMSALPNHMGQLRMIQLENEQLRDEKAGLLQKLKNTKVVSDAEHLEQNSDQGSAKTFQIMQRELDHCRDREKQIRANNEERIEGLQTQLHKAKAEVETQMVDNAADTLSHKVAAMQELVNTATMRREDLHMQLRTVREERDHAGDPSIPPTNPDIQRLLAQSERQKDELTALQQEVALQHEREMAMLRKKVEQLSEELEELQRVREDERVRRESEVRELKNERDIVKDRLDDAITELQHLKANAEALENLHAQAFQEIAGPTQATSEFKRLQQLRELEHLQKCQEDRKRTIQDLEREQEALVEKTSLMTAQVGTM